MRVQLRDYNRETSLYLLQARMDIFDGCSGPAFAPARLTRQQDDQRSSLVKEALPCSLLFVTGLSLGTYEGAENVC